ncbi:lipase 1-like [Planococcus citri]|uniref:lipase 1-like n=1 Tax=Planococcus citri TaxID=170843 RepID=UPI0031F84FB7
MKTAPGTCAELFAFSFRVSNLLRLEELSSMYRVLLVLILTQTAVYGQSNETDLTFMTTPELLTHWGYEVESHTIKTEDHYLLTIHRIPNRKSKYYPILVQHGILMASDSWVLRGPKEDLVLLLADAGFDVWLANTRGNYYSKSHATYKNVQKRFWNFGWNELGLYDIPCMIRHVQRITGQSKIVHMGHSMGTTSFYTMLTKKPEMNEKIFAHVSLAPVAYMDHMKSLIVLRPIVKLIHQLIALQNRLKLYDLFARDVRLTKLIQKICNVNEQNKRSCYRIVFHFIGFDYSQLREEDFDRFMGHFPSGASAGMLLHYFQNAISREFREFDYGHVLNLEKYGTPVPPLYNLTKVTAPVYIYYSTNDYLSHNLDVERLAKKLPNVKKKYLVPYKYFNHMDYIWAKDAKKLLFDDVIETMKDFLL